MESAPLSPYQQQGETNYQSLFEMGNLAGGAGAAAAAGALSRQMASVGGSGSGSGIGCGCGCGWVRSLCLRWSLSSMDGLRMSKKWTARRRYLLVCVFNTTFSVLAGLLLPYALQNKWMTMPEYLMGDCGINPGTTDESPYRDEMINVCVYRVSLRRGGVALMLLFTALAVGSWFDARVHGGFWVTKYVAFVCLQAVLFFSQFVFSSDWMSDVWGIFDDVGRVAGSCWLVVQGVALLDLSHEAHMALLLRALRAEHDKHAALSRGLYGAHLCASLLVMALVLMGLGHTMKEVLPQQCSSPYAIATSQLLLLCTMLLGLGASLAGLFACVNKGLLIPALTFAYQGLVCYSIVTSDLCQRPVVAPVAPPGTSIGILSIPFASLANSVESVMLTLLHVVCVYAVATDQSRSVNKAVALLGAALCPLRVGGGGAGGGSGSGAGSGSGSGSEYSSVAGSTDELTQENTDEETASSHPHSPASNPDVPPRRLSVKLGAARSGDEADDEDDYLFNYKGTESRDGRGSPSNPLLPPSLPFPAGPAGSRDQADIASAAGQQRTAIAYPDSHLDPDPYPSPNTGSSPPPSHGQPLTSISSGYLSFRVASSSALASRRPNHAGAPLSDVAFHIAMALASAYVPLLLTNWDSPYGEHSDFKVLHLWPRLAAQCGVWLLYAASMVASCVYYARLQQHETAPLLPRRV